MSVPGAAWYPDPNERAHASDRFAPVMPSAGGAPVASLPAVTPLPRVDSGVPTAPPSRLLPPADFVVRPKHRWWKVRRAGAVFLAIALLGLGAYAAGLLDRLTVAGPSRKASSATVKVHEASGYSFEAPNFWLTQSADDTSTDYSFDVLHQSVVGIGTTRVDRSVDVADPAVRAFLFETASRGFQFELGGIPLTSTAPFAVDGAEGQQVVISGSGADGRPTEASQTVFIHGRRVFTVTIITHGFLADSGKTQAEFEALLASFRFR